MAKRILIALISCVLTVFLAEIILRCLHINQSYSESMGNGYITYWGAKMPTWYWLNTPNYSYTVKNADFTYSNHTNGIGHRELEPEQLFSDNCMRAIVFGDSYTEGVGTVYDSSFVRHLERLMNQKNYFGHCVKFYNAGSAGSDPFYYYTLLRDKLIYLKPQLVIVTINPSDYTDYIYRGGFERFHADSTTVFRPAPPQELLYHYSYLYRAWCSAEGYVGNFQIKVKDFFNLFEDANSGFVQVADSLNVLSVKEKFKLVFLLHPGRILDLGSKERSYIFKIQINQLADDLRAKNMEVVNVYEPMDSVINDNNIRTYGHIHDGHYTSQGYQLMASSFFERFQKLDSTRR